MTKKHDDRKKSSANYYKLADHELDVMNPSVRCPVVLLLDTSRSMKGAPLDELKKALYMFVKELKDDIAANSSVELCIITLDENAQTVIPFTCMEDLEPVMLDLKASGGTFLGKALTKGMEEIRARRELYRKNGIPSYAPWAVLMTDGRPGDNWKTPAEEMLAMAQEMKMQYFGIGIGAKADQKMLKEILPPPGPLTLSHVRFKDFFKWLSASLSMTSASCSSEEVQPIVCSWKDLF